MLGVRFNALWRLFSLAFGVSKLDNHLIHNGLFKSYRVNYFSSSLSKHYKQDLKHGMIVPSRYLTDVRNISRGIVSSRRVRLVKAESSLEIKKLGARQAEEVRVGSSIALVFTTPAIQGWNCSKELCLSGYVVQRIAGNLLTSGFHSSSAWQDSCKRGNDNEEFNTRDPCECIKKPKDICDDTTTEKNICNQREDPCTIEEKRTCCSNEYTKEVCQEKSSSESDVCEKACSSTVCNIRRLVCPPPSLRELHPTVDNKVVTRWRMLCLFVIMPIVIISGFLLISKSNKSKKQPRPPFLDVPYLHHRTRAYPWGDGVHSLFHNPRTNGIPPDGYEVDDPYAEETEEK